MIRIRVVVGHFILITVACVDVVVVALRIMVVLIIAVIANMCAVVIAINVKVIVIIVRVIDIIVRKSRQRFTSMHHTIVVHRRMDKRAV